MAFLPQEIIRRKRGGDVQSAPDIHAFVAGITNGSVTNERVSPLAMAVFFRGMALEERLL